MATIDQFISSLVADYGDDGKGEKFEIFCKWFLQNDPGWSKTVDKVWLWKEYPEKWQRQDLGTDIVFRDKNGDIWAVQAKCFSEHRSTKKEDMNSFLADSGRKNVSKRLWMQTTNKMEAKAFKTLKDQDKPVTVFNLDDFREAKIEYPSCFAELSKAKLKQKPNPEEHQLMAINEVVSKLQSADRGQMIMACGTGKTFTSLWIKEALNAQISLVLLPSLSLLSQTMREWAWASRTHFEILNVCSDNSVGKKTEDMDPSDAPFSVTSDVKVIKNFLNKAGNKVIFCTYQSSELIAEVQKDKKIPTFDLIIADEAHRCAGRVSSGFAVVLDGKKIRSKKRLFTTATPRYFSKSVKDAANSTNLAVVDMSDKIVFGEVLHKLTFGNAIRQDLLNDYQVLIIGVDEPQVKQLIDDYKIVEIGPHNITDARTLASGVGVLKAIKDYNLKRVISFHSRIIGAQKFSQELNQTLDLIDPLDRPKGIFFTDFVSGNMNTGFRKEKIDRLKSLDGYDIGILSNARCLSEGIDVPSLDGIAFVDPKGSQVDIIQAVGRAIRKDRDAELQKKGTIVIPVFIEAGDNHISSIEASNFKPVWDVLRALRAHDEVLADQIDQCRTNMAKKISFKNKFPNNKIIFDIPDTVDKEFSSAIKTILIEKTSISWQANYELVLDYLKKNNNKYPVSNAIINNIKIGAWLGQQRTYYRNSILQTDRKKKMEALPNWSWTPLLDFWSDRIEELKEFYKTNGHLWMKVDTRLGVWLSKIRKDRINLPDDLIKELTELPGWFWTYDDFWISELKIFEKEHNHLYVPNGYRNHGKALGRWVARTRSNRKNLSVELLNALEAMPKWSWKVEDIFSRKVKLLEEYSKTYKSTNVPIRHISPCGTALGTWVNYLRMNEDVISEEQKRVLENIPYWTWEQQKEQQWNNQYEALKKYAIKNGHTKVPSSLKKPDGFGMWVSLQRSQLRATKTPNSLQKKRIQKLEAVPNWFWTLEEFWLMQVRDFFVEHGHVMIDTLYINSNGHKLGGFVTRVRSYPEKFSQELKEELNKYETWCWSNEEKLWKKGFYELKLFFGEHNRLPRNRYEKSPNGQNVGRWFKAQMREDHGRNKMEDRMFRTFIGLAQKNQKI